MCYWQREEALRQLHEECKKVRLLLGHVEEWAQRWIYRATSMGVREREREEEGEDLVWCWMGLPWGETCWLTRE
jgi:hypothetical protein